jgi:PilZ domain-containing protein
MKSGPGEMRYLVLADRAVPYLLARVRWPDVAQAISAARPDWIDDQGLFDLPYDPGAVTVSFPQAASVAAGWGRQLHAEAAEGAPSYIRRMPANWSDLSPSERRTWGIEFVGRRRVPARRARHLRPFQAKTAAAQANSQVDALSRPPGGPGAGIDGPAANGRGQLADVRSTLGNVATERRRHARVQLDGRAYIRCEQTTISAGLVDLSQGGVRCVLPEAPSLVAAGAKLGGPFLLEVEVDTSRICLGVAGRISWHGSNGVSGHFGVGFGELSDDETEGVQRFLAAADRKGVRR